MSNVVKRRLVFSVSWLLFGISLLDVYLSLQNGTLLLKTIFNSDILYLPALYRALATTHDISGWQFSRAPYFFPDMVLYFTLSFVSGGDFRLAMILYGVCQIGLFIFGLMLLASLIFERPWPAQFLIVLAGAFSLLDLAATGAPFFFRMIFQNSHFGSVLSLVWSLIFVLLFIRTRSAPAVLSLVVLFVISALSVVSDPLFIFQFCLPCACAACLLFSIERRILSKLVLLLITLLGSAITGIVMYPDLVQGQSVSQFVQFNAGPAGGSAVSIFEIVIRTWQIYRYESLIWMAFISVGLLTILWIIRTARLVQLSEQSGNVALIVSFILFMVISNGVGAMLAGWVDERYFIPAMIFPMCFGWPFIFAQSRRISVFIDSGPGMYTGALLVILIGITHLPVIKDVAVLKNGVDYYPAFNRCMDEETQKRGLHNGLAHYWQARYLTMLSKTGLNVVQVNADLSPFHWTNDLNDYRVENFDFVVIDNDPRAVNFKLNEPEIESRFGVPAETFVCGYSKVLVYNRAADDAFRRVFTEDPELVSFTQPGDSAHFRPNILPSQIGRIVGQVRRAGTGDPAGYLAFGPYVELPSGTYRFNYKITADNSGQKEDAWDVIGHSPGSDAPAFLILAGNLGDVNEGSLTGEFTLSQPTVIEVRVHYSGVGSLTINGLDIERVQ